MCYRNVGKRVKSTEMNHRNRTLMLNLEQSGGICQKEICEEEEVLDTSKRTDFA